MDSTNNYAMAQVAVGAASHGTLFFAHEQWAGKGQRGRAWTSNPGENIVLSAVIEPVALASSQAFPLSACAALSCYDLFSRYAGTEEAAIKWPNDLYWRDRKAGGVLIENHFRGERWVLAIVGMGMNINQVQFPEAARNPVSLKQITGASFDAVALARELGECLDNRYRELEQGGAAGLVAEYNRHLYGRDKTVRLKKDNAVFETTVKEVTILGELITRDRMERRFGFGEVEWII